MASWKSDGTLRERSDPSTGLALVASPLVSQVTGFTEYSLDDLVRPNRWTEGWTIGLCAEGDTHLISRGGAGKT
jgi:hypothetical protein